jgi:RNA-directed DNA polymerase
MGLERRGRVIQGVALWPTAPSREEPGERAEAGRQAVCDFQAAGLRGMAQGQGQPGAEGVDEQSIQAFEANLRGNLYKLWNRMSSGSYMPPPVKAVEIPKKKGGSRVLGVPAVADRVAQTVAYLYLEPEVEPVFHPDSYGYRPGRSAHYALATCRQRCWKYDWVLDLDLESFFYSLDHSLVLKAVAHHTNLRWILLYVGWWLKAPLQVEDGTLKPRDRGSPQGSGISPVLANIFLHYALDLWLVREFPDIPFERYADDAILHCKSEAQARELRDAIIERLARVGLELNLDKTRVVYCKDSKRKGSHDHERLDFLGYTFRPRLARSRAGEKFVALARRSPTMPRRRSGTGSSSHSATPGARRTSASRRP